MDNIYGIVYLMQIKINLRNKDYLLKYVGQTIDFNKRKKQHIRDLNTGYSSKNNRIRHHFLRNVMDKGLGAIESNLFLKDLSKSLLEALDKQTYNFTIIGKAKDKKELNCMEFANMFIYDPEMNSFYSEANCKDVSCKICSNWMLWGRPRGKANDWGWESKWHWPPEEFYITGGKIFRKKRINKIMNGEDFKLKYYKNLNAGFLPIKSEKLWNKK